MLTAAGIALLLVAIAALGAWLARAVGSLKADSATGLETRNAEVERRLQGVIETMDRRLSQLDTKVDRRLEHASEQTNAIHKQLGDVGRATSQLAEQAKDLAAPAAATPAEGSRRLRRAPAREPARRPAPTERVLAPAHVPERREGGCRHSCREAGPGRRQVSARQFRAVRRGARRRGAPTPR